MMNAEYIEHAIKHCRAYGLNNIADQADVELARLRAVEADNDRMRMALMEIVTGFIGSKEMRKIAQAALKESES